MNTKSVTEDRQTDRRTVRKLYAARWGHKIYFHVSDMVCRNNKNVKIKYSLLILNILPMDDRLIGKTTQDTHC